MSNNLLTPILTLFTLLSLSAQDLNLDHFDKLNIRNIGPAGMSGRITAIDVPLAHPNHIYVGSASGGVWKSESGGIAWEPIFDDAPLQSIGALKINQNNPDEIWVGTGEGNPRNSHNSGAGLYRTLDGGRNWELMGLENTQLIHRIILHRDDPNTIWVGALGAAWGPSEDRGVYKSTDGGKTWKKVLYINNETGIADLVVDPENPNKLIAATWEFGRKPWKFNSGGKGSGLHLSYDGGETWTDVSKEKKSGLPKGPLGRIGIAIAPSKPNIVYALVEAKENGLYQSTDGGHQWSLVSKKNIGNRPFYYAEIYIDPYNENRIWNLWTYVSKSEDGGKTFETILDYGTNVHPDHHAFWLSPDDPDYLIDGNDGGLNISRDGGKNWRFVENLPVGQFYHVNYDMSIPYQVGGGMQDNGTWVGPSSNWKRGGTRNADWREVMFGDGFDLIFKKGNPRFGFAMSQGGNVSYYDYKTGNNVFIKPQSADDTELRFNWDAAIAQDPYKDCGIYFGSQFVHYSTDCGQSWTVISPDLTTNDTIKQNESKVTGGLTKDVTQAENFTTITCIAPSPVDQQVIWAGTDDGNLQITKDGGKNWINVANRMTGLPTGSWFHQIEVSTKNAGEAFAAVNNYRRNDYTPYVYHTTNFGQTWQRIANADKVDGYAMAIVQDPEAENLLFLGTDRGLYFSLNKGSHWQKWDKNYPSVPTRDLKIHPREHDLIIATFGRALWIMDDIRPLRALADNRTVLNQDIKLFDAPDAYLSSYRSVDGVRFVADAEFRGPNKSPNAHLSLWVKPKKEDKEKVKAEKGIKNKKDKKQKLKNNQTEKPDEQKDAKSKKGKGKKDKAAIVIYDTNRDTVRNFTIKVKPGLNRFDWRLNSNGIRYPSHRDSKPDADPPGGPRVVPGNYEVVVSYGDARDSTMVTVHPNPHIDTSLAGLKRKRAAQVALGEQIEMATEDFNRLKKAKKTVELVNKTMVHAPDSVQKDLKELGKAMTDSLNQLQLLFMNPPDAKGIQYTSDKLTSMLWPANGYFNESQDGISPNGKNARDRAIRKIKEINEKVNAFFEKDWKQYRTKVEAVEIDLFGD